MGKISYKNLLLYILLLFIFSLLIISNSFAFLRFSISDRLHGGKAVLDDIVIIAIDDQSINEIGRWPWNRDLFAQLLNKLDNPKAIGIDVSFFEPSNNDSSLQNALNNRDNVVLAAEISEQGFFEPIFDVTHGYVNLFTNSDGITRGFDKGLQEDVIPFAFQVYQESLPSNVVKVFDNKRYLVNYADIPGSFNTISFKEALTEDISFEDKIVLIGATAPNLHDNYFVPTSQGVAMSGVEIHANILQNIIFDNFLVRQGTLSLLFIMLIASILGFFFLSKMKPHYIIGIILGLVIVYSIIGIYAFNNFNYLIDFFFAPIALFIFTASGLAVNYFEEKKHSAYVTEAFGRYVSKDLLSEIIEKKQELKLGGARREITVFFSDIRGFTSISEKLSPEKLVHLVNEYLTEMTKIILENKGTVDKFIGDAIMAFWNAPFLEKDHPKLACQTAIAQIKELDKLKKSWKKRKLPEMDIGIGINTGDAVIGNLGSEDRFDYTAMGDAVNLSSRLEGLTKQYGVSILISESTYKKVKSDFDFRELDKVKVKGKKITVKIYQLLVEPNDKLVEEFEKGLNLYYKKKFKEAKKHFEACPKIKKDDVPSRIFIERCEAFLKSSPKKGWDGSYEAKEK